MIDSEDSAPGWDAIAAQLDALYPGVEPHHYGTLVKWRLGGNDPLDGISAYPRAGHWHIVTFGLSELYSKESEDLEESGWGFELTFRLARADDEDEPPMWAMGFLQNIARYVFTTGNAFAPGHHLDINGPICQEAPGTAIRAIAFVDDPELDPIDTPHGRLRFLQVVGLTTDEYAVVERWNSQRLLAAMTPYLPLLVTDLDRDGLTRHPQVAAAIEEGIRRDGSSTGFLFVEQARWRVERDTAGQPRTTLTLDAIPAPRIGRVLAARLPFGRGLLLRSQESGIGLRCGERFTVTEEGNAILAVELPPAALAELTEALESAAGTYPLAAAPGLTVEIVGEQPRDQAGEVVSEVG
ncbi:suppressor of fused domain protein [Melissospora conviva]|uniref:suppressor of fused domain protein n=1 Tax=Melissospora conviva TaxID=3388432 RepID=UPI003B794A3E